MKAEAHYSRSYVVNDRGNCSVTNACITKGMDYLDQGLLHNLKCPSLLSVYDLSISRKKFFWNDVYPFYEIKLQYKSYQIYTIKS